MKISYNWLKSYLPDIPEPHHLADLFTYHICEVESVEKLADGNYLFDLGVLPNRTHDLLSHQGVAHELAGLLGIPFKDPTLQYKTPSSKSTQLKIEIQSDLCRRYMGRIIRNVAVGPSSEWMVKYLESIGQRSINNVVDATNIVMYDCGQPCHAFDLDKVHGEKIIINNAKTNEKVLLLDNKEVEIDQTVLTIADEHNTLALAGVKGGKHAYVRVHTTDILIEVANFDPVSVRKTARRLGLLTDSAKRFENDVSLELCSSAMFALSALLLEFFPEAMFEDVVDVYPNPPQERKVQFSHSYIDSILGVKISQKEIEDILTRYDYTYEKQGDVYTVAVPMLRLDITGPHDMAEEIGRVYGYDKLKPRIPEINFIPKGNDIYEKIMKARDILVYAGYREVMTYAFADTGEVEVLASASDKKFLRKNLRDGIKKSYELNKLNAPLLGFNEIKIFEIGTVFKDSGEVVHVCYADKKEIKEMPVDEFIKNASSEELFLGSSDLPAEELDGRGQTTRKGSSDFAPVMQIFKPWSIYPFISRDIAVWVPEGTLSEVLSEIYIEFGTELLQGNPILFDQFTKNAKTSYAFRLIFQSYDRTLTDEEVNVIMSHITEKISSLGFEAR